MRPAKTSIPGESFYPPAQTLRLVNTFLPTHPGTFQTSVSVLGLWLSDIVCWPFRSRVSIFYGLALLELIPADFSKPDFLKACLPGIVPVTRGAGGASPPHTLGRISLPLIPLQPVVAMLRVWFLPYLYPSYPSWYGFFVFSCVKSPASLQVVFGVSCIICHCGLSVSVGGDQFRILLLCHLSLFLIMGCIISHFNLRTKQSFIHFYIPNAKYGHTINV